MADQTVDSNLIGPNPWDAKVLQNLLVRENQQLRARIAQQSMLIDDIQAENQRLRASMAQMAAELGRMRSASKDAKGK